MKTTTDFNTSRVAVMNLRDHHSYPGPVRCNHLVLILCTRGETLLEINYVNYNLKKGGFLVIKPLDIVTPKSEANDFDATMLMLPPESFTAIMHDINIANYNFIQRNPIVYHNEEYLAVIKGIFSLLNSAQSLLCYDYFKTFAEKQVASLFFVQNHYYSTSSDYKRNDAKEPFSRKKEIFRNFIKSIIESHTMSREVLFYANELGVSSGYLNEVCNEVSEHSAKDIIDSAVAARLKYELSYTSKNIQELSDEYNFPSQSYFSRYYKRLTGTTPSEFRKKRAIG